MRHAPQSGKPSGDNRKWVAGFVMRDASPASSLLVLGCLMLHRAPLAQDGVADAIVPRDESHMEFHDHFAELPLPPTR